MWFDQTEEWTDVYSGFDFDELYNLREDPHCMWNLAEDSRCRGVIEEMCRQMCRRAYEEPDIICNPYATVRMAPFGPMVGLRGLA